MLRIKYKELIFSILLIFFILVITFLIAFDYERPNDYLKLWTLPFAYIGVLALIKIFFQNAFKNKVFLVILGLFALRNVITPFFMFLGKYKGSFNYIDNKDVDKAILLMLYETLIVSLFAARMASKKNLVNGASYKNDISYSNINNCKAIVVCSFLIIFLLLLIFLAPESLSSYSTVFQLKESRIDFEEITNTNSLSTLVQVLLPITYLFTSVFLIGNINNKISNKCLKMILNILLIFVPFLFMNNNEAFTLISFFALALTSMYTGGINKKLFAIINIAVFASITLIVFFALDKKGYSTFEMLSKNLQAYFPGVCNFAGFFNMEKHDVSQSLFYDLYYTIPFRNTLFGIQGDYRLVKFYTDDNFANSNIIPCACQLFYYFSYFAPFLECGFVFFIFKNIDNFKRTNNIFLKFSYSMLIAYLIATPIMYNFTIFFSRFFVPILPLLILSKIVESKNKMKVKKLVSSFQI